ncbi:MAG TPA: class I SAM-dependent methyltransferase [Rhizomicrobium sp.]|nr:class I SAM-dependent methyltransferase [Rhizomicrobium sp.]
MAGDQHAALMDKVYRRQRYIYDLTRRYYLFGRDRLIRELALRPGEAVVEVGCGTARNLIRIARLYPGTELYGLDASSEMLKTAAGNIQAAGLSGRIKLVQGYAEALAPSLFGRDRPFDRVLFPYSLSMIPDWRQALAAAGASLGDSGRLHVVDFGDLTGLGPVAGGLLRAWLRLFHVEPRVEILRTLERQTNHAADPSSQIVLLPARYAFLWTSGKWGTKAFAE